MTNEINEKILVVDDDLQIQRALRLALSSRKYNVLLASTGEEALDIVFSRQPDLVVLDLTLPGISGIEVCKEIRSWSKIPIIILSVRQNEKDKIAALDLGADDYVTKPFNTGELLARIRANLRRMKPASGNGALYEIKGLTVDLFNHRIFLDGQEIRLTKTEFSLLKYFVENSGRVINYGLALSKVWGPEYETDVQTLRVHVANLRKKIERDPNRPQFIITEPGVGYRFISL